MYRALLYPGRLFGAARYIPTLTTAPLRPNTRAFAAKMPSKTDDKYTDPELRAQVKEEIQEGDKGGAPGQWSARKVLTCQCPSTASLLTLCNCRRK